MHEDQINNPIIGETAIPRRAVFRGVVGVAATTALLAAGWTVDAAVQAQETTPAASPEALPGPVKIVILYRQPTDPVAFEEYYLGTHVPMLLQIPAVQRLEAGHAAGSTPRNPKAFYRIVSLYFTDQASMRMALTSTEAEAVLTDLRTLVTTGVLPRVTATLVAGLESRFSLDSQPSTRHA